MPIDPAHVEPATKVGSESPIPSEGFWRLILAFHASVLLAWLWLMPKGFGWHQRTVANLVLPCLGIALLASAVVLGKRRLRLFCFAVFVTVGFWTGLGIFAVGIFPSSGWRIVVVACTARLGSR